MDVFPFLVGSARSGTTLLRVMLDSHPVLAIPGESHFIDGMAAKKDRYERPNGFATDLFLDDLWRSSRFRLWGLQRDDLSDLLHGVAGLDLADALRCVYRAYAWQHDKHRYGDKTPRYVLHMDALAELFPEARFVHIIRDGRDAALSMLDMDWRGVPTLTEAARFWRDRVKTGRRVGKELGPDRYREVRYEALIADPEDSLRSVCHFIDLDFDDAMLRYYERGDGLLASTRSPHTHQGVHRPPTKGLRDWRSTMSPAELELFEVIAGDLLSELGYERACPAPSASTKARVTTVLAGAALSRTWRRAGRLPSKLFGTHRG